MRKLDRFIVKAFIGPFVAILCVVVFILMMQTLWLYIDELVGKVFISLPALAFIQLESDHLMRLISVIREAVPGLNSAQLAYGSAL